VLHSSRAHHHRGRSLRLTGLDSRLDQPSLLTLYALPERNARYADYRQQPTANSLMEASVNVEKTTVAHAILRSSLMNGPHTSRQTNTDPFAKSRCRYPPSRPIPPAPIVYSTFPITVSLSHPVFHRKVPQSLASVPVQLLGPPRLYRSCHRTSYKYQTADPRPPLTTHLATTPPPLPTLESALPTYPSFRALLS
jgi:hypothetical protein